MSEPQTTADALKVALVLSSQLEPGPAANVAACVAAGLCAARPGWAGRPLTDRCGRSSVSSSHQPIIVLKAAPEALAELWGRIAAVGHEGSVCLFPAYAREMHDAAAYWDSHAGRDHAVEPLLGLGLVGPRNWVGRLVGRFALWR